MKESRIAGIDAFRLLAAFSVVLLHVGEYSGLDPFYGIKLRLLGRWAVPFFFIVSGYFIAPYIVKDHSKIATTSAKTVIVFALSNFLLIPLSIASTGFEVTFKRAFSPQIFIDGTYDHLWFLSSLAFAMLVFYTLLSYKAYKTISTIAAIGIALLLIDAYYPERRPIWLFARYMSCFPFIYFGITARLKNFNPKIQFSLIIICFGILLQTFEAFMLERFFNKNPLEHDFLLGTIPFAIGMFCISLRLPKTKVISFLSDLGIKYSLGIYIFHPYFTYALQEAKDYFIVNEALFSIVVAPLAFSLTLFSMFLLNRYFPLLFKLISADQQALQKVDSLNPMPVSFPQITSSDEK